MATFKELSAAHCILLAASLACDGNIDALRAVTLAQPQLFDSTLAYRLMLSFLPETIDPEHYTGYVADLSGKRSHTELDAEVLAAAQAVDVGPVAGLPDVEAREKLARLPLRPLKSSYGSSAAASLLREAPDDPLVHFLISRSYAIDRETGLTHIIPRLLKPFLHRSLYLRTWYISNVLPWTRFESEYYGQDDTIIPLDFLESLDDQAAISTLMSKAAHSANDASTRSYPAGRDLRGLVGPWVFGSGQRKRRKLGYRRLPLDGEERLRKNAAINRDGGVKCKISKCDTSHANVDEWRLHVDQTHSRLCESIKQETFRNPDTPRRLLESDATGAFQNEDCKEAWQRTFQWLVTQSTRDFDFATKAIDEWGGPSDVDLGDGEESDGAFPADQRTARELRDLYCQSVFACVYATPEDTPEAIQGAHTALARLSELLDFVPPPDLVTSVDLLPRIEQQQKRPLEEYSKQLLHFDSLLSTEQLLTVPNLESYSMLQMFTYSAYQLQYLGHPISVAQVAKMTLSSDKTDAVKALQTVLASQVRDTKQDTTRWSYNRSILLFLWTWALTHSPDGLKEGYGVFGSIDQVTFEREILKAMLAAGQYDLVKRVYLPPAVEECPLEGSVVEAAIVELIYEHFDAASNGNRTRGSMKRAAELLSAFSAKFGKSSSFKQVHALIAATHALSFYSLTFEGGVPTRPSRLRQTNDVIALIRRVLEQNPRSYSKLDDLIDIGRNLAIALPPNSNTAFMDFSSVDLISDEATRLENMGRLVTGTAIEAALAEDDFETAYSYTVNRLDTSNGAQRTDDTSWRAALAAGKHRPSAQQQQTNSTKQTRRLEQRLDLLARALSLAPAAATPEILSAWRRAEEELLTLLAATADEERAADDAADRKRLSGGASGGRSALPGGFGDEQLDSAFAVQPSRREVGRGAAEEAPMGLFDVARGAARAFGRTVDTQRRAASTSKGGGQAPAASKATQHQQQKQGEDGEEEEEDGAEWDEWGEEGEGDEAGGERVRKRDFVANSLARGVGWMLGATPINEQQEGQQRGV